MCAWFVSAKIEKIGTCYLLRVKTTWWSFWTIEETYVFTSLQEAKEKLLDLRCKGNLVIDDKK